jgi:hypothetical protein
MRTSLKIALRAAKASQIAAEASRNSVEDARKKAIEDAAQRSILERAHIFGGGTRGMVMDIGTLGGPTPRQTQQYEIHIHNMGRWPAILRRIRWGFCSDQKSEMPAVPEYNGGDMPFTDSVPPGRQSQLTKVVDIPFDRAPQAVVVRFDYFDVFLQKEDWAGFVQRITPNEAHTIPIDAPDGYIRHT